MRGAMLQEARKIRKGLTERYWHHRANMSWDNWIHRWPGWKQKAILEAVLHEDVDAPDIVTAMVKREVLVGMDSDGIQCSLKTPKKARLIHFYRYLSTQERHALRYYCFQKAVCDVFNGKPNPDLDDDIRVTVSSAMNQHDKGRWFDDARLWAGPNAYVFERDGASWDATMGEEHMDVQLEAMGELEADFLETVQATRKCRVNFRHTAAKREALDFLGRFRYELDHTTKSGHNDTSSRNSLINAIITRVALLSLGVREARVIVIGDDMLCFLKHEVDLQSLLKAEEDCGIKPTGAAFTGDAISRVEFASDAFAPSTEGTIAIPKLGKLFAKLYATTTFVKPAETNAFAHSIATGLRDLLLEAPLYGDFLRCSLDESGATATLQLKRWERRVNSRVYYDDSFTHWLGDRYGITPSQIVELSAFLRSCRGPGFMKHPMIEKIMAIDTADPKDRC